MNDLVTHRESKGPSAHERRREERLESILTGLSDVQRQAATHLEGPMVVFAGAGSGKTRIITHRIAWLIEKGVPPWEILALTFTNKAAGEMRARVDGLSPFGRRVLIATFHSACARWLREFAPELGYTSDFTIYDDKDSLTAIKTVLKEMQVRLDDEVTAADYKAAIGRLKTMAMLPSDERIGREYADIVPPAGIQVYQRYQEYLAACNAMDFGDLIMNVLLLLRRNKLVRDVLRRRYRYIMVDEYQDTNRTQFELIARLAEGHRNLFVVGDDDQSIYSWRGAVPSNIIDFDKTYPDARRITMEQNYRCTGNIVDAANAMIANNKYRVQKRLFTENDGGELLTYRLETDNEVEAWYVVDEVKAGLGRFPLTDTAIFYRTNAQSRLLEDALRRENIPYQIYGTVRFYDRMEIKDLMAYFKLSVNERDDLSLKRIINVPPRGIGTKAIDMVETEAKRREIPMLEAVRQLVEEGAPRLGTKLKGFLDLYEDLKREMAATPMEELLEVLLDKTGYLDYVDKRFPDQAVDKTENIHELGAAIADFAQRAAEAGKQSGVQDEGAPPAPTLSDWLQTVTLQSEESADGQGVSLMTLHMAKGLEFPRVFIVGVEEGLLPHRNSLDDPSSLEEERRLFYVGMTRAMSKLQLVGAYRRRTYNQWSGNRPSRFLSEIPSRHFEAVTEAEATVLQSSSERMTVMDTGEVAYDYGDPAAPEVEITLQRGSGVRHPTYGKGIVESVENEFGMIKAVVRFHEFGVRKVMVRHLSLI